MNNILLGVSPTLDRRCRSCGVVVTAIAAGLTVVTVVAVGFRVVVRSVHKLTRTCAESNL